MGRHVMRIMNNTLRSQAMDLVRKAPEGTRIEFSRNVRSLEQNDRMWAMLGEISRNATHHGQQYDPNDWKVLFMEALGQEQRLAPSLTGRGIVPLNTSSSKMTVSEMTELMDFMEAWCAENGVILTDPRKDERAA